MSNLYSSLSISFFTLVTIQYLLLFIFLFFPYLSAQQWVTYGPNITNPKVWSIRPYLTKPFNSSYKTLSLGTTIPLVGSQAIYSVYQQSAYAFYIDILNSRGGLMVNGENYYLSLSWTSDDSSTSYLQLLWNDLASNPNYTAFVAPASDSQLQSVLPIITSTNKVVVCTLSQDAADYATGYPYIYTGLATSDYLPLPTINAINQRAALYYNQVISGVVSPLDSSPISQYGILSICMYWVNDNVPAGDCHGIRNWVNQTNTQRLINGAQQEDLINIIVDMEWDILPTTIDPVLYVKSFSLCPPRTDVLIVCGELPQTPNYTAALRTSRVRPKSAFTTSVFINYDNTNAQQIFDTGGWVGWVPFDPNHPVVATIPGIVFPTTAALNSDFLAYKGRALATPESAVVRAFEMLTVGYTSANSTNSIDFRRSLLNINGSNEWSKIIIDPVTGVNNGYAQYLVQVGQNGVYNFFQNTYLNTINIPSIIYPYNWAWAGIVLPGDVINQSQANTNVLIALVLSVLGSWVSTILVEQSVFIRRRGGYYQFWLLIVATSLGGAGIWCAVWMQSAALSLTKPGDTDPLDIGFSLDIALVALLPSLLLVYAGLYLMIQDIDDQSSEKKKTSAANEIRRLEREKAEERKKRAALSFKAHCYHLIEAISWRVIVGSWIIFTAILLTRYTIWYNWIQDANWNSSLSAWIAATFINLILIPISMLQFFHGLRHRFVAVFLFAAAVMSDYQIHLASMTFYWQPANVFTPSSLYVTSLNVTTVNLITGIMAAVTCFGFIGLQFSRMQLSRNGLALLVANLENVINKLRSALKSEQEDIIRLRQQSDQLVKIIECINIIRPIPKEYAFALAIQANTATFVQQFGDWNDNKVTENAIPNSSPSVMKKSVNNEISSQMRDSRPGSTIAYNRVIATGTSNGKSLAWPEKETSLAQQENEDQYQQQQLNDSIIEADSDTSKKLSQQDVNNQSNQQTKSVDSLVKIKTSSIVPSNGATTKDVKKFALSDATIERTNNSNDDDNKEVERSSAHSINSLSASIPCATLLSTEARLKQYELDILQVLDSQADHADVLALIHGRRNKHSINGEPGGNRSSLSGGQGDLNNLINEFPLTQPLLGKQPDQLNNNNTQLLVPSSATTSTSKQLLDTSSAAPTWSTPTLSQLLSHPVCLELLKDELNRIHSTENLIFYLHVVRYKRLNNAKLRKQLATAIFDSFIKENADQQININTRQRESIATIINKKGTDTCSNGLFREAEREVLILMETNLMKTYIHTTSYRICTWIFHSLDMNAALGYQQYYKSNGERLTEKSIFSTHAATANQQEESRIQSIM